MQTIKRVNPNAFPIMDDIDRLYAYLSDKHSTALLYPTYDSSFKSLIDTFNTNTSENWKVNYTELQCRQIEPIVNNNIVLTFSGGKDSIASALRYKESGYTVYLYHMKHINPSFSDEWKCAQESASILGLPIFFDDIQFSGHHMYMEHPMKNMIIANGALSFGIREGIGTTIAFGNYLNSYLEDNVFERCAGDCVDMWETYEKIIQKVIPDFRIQMNVENMGDTLDKLADNTDLLNASLSCLCRHSLRDYRREWVKNKFGVELFQRRCGSCYKCCIEYVYMADHNKLVINKPYYKYCLSQLLKVLVAEEGAQSDIGLFWQHFFAYPQDNSCIADELSTAKIINNRLKWS